MSSSGCRDTTSSCCTERQKRRIERCYPERRGIRATGDISLGSDALRPNHCGAQVPGCIALRGSIEQKSCTDVGTAMRHAPGCIALMLLLLLALLLLLLLLLGACKASGHLQRVRVQVLVRVAIHLPGNCHAVAMQLPCNCNAIAMHLRCNCHATAMLLPL